MSLSELMAVVLPPQNPIEIGNETQMAAIEEKLGTRLPDDYRALAEKFGTGRFTDSSETVCIGVLNPFAPVFFKCLNSEFETLRKSQEIFGSDRFPYKPFPEKPGLLPWGYDDNGCTMYWLVEGLPNDWPVIVNPPRYCTYQKIQLSMTTFLAQIFTRQLTCILWPDPEFFSTPVVFEPTTELRRIVLERS